MATCATRYCPRWSCSAEDVWVDICAALTPHATMTTSRISPALHLAPLMGGVALPGKRAAALATPLLHHSRPPGFDLPAYPDPTCPDRGRSSVATDQYRRLCPEYRLERGTALWLWLLPSVS